MNNTSSLKTAHQVINVAGLTNAEMNALNLSFYTLCKWADVTHLTDPRFCGDAIKRGEYRGILTLDAMGNFISFA